MEALFVTLDVQLEIALISLVVVHVGLEEAIDEGDSVLHVLRLAHQVLPESLDGLEATAGSLEDRLRDEHVCIAHELLILAHLRIEEVGEDFTRYQLVLLSRQWCNWSLGLSA